jgi:hypothetical protein
MISEEFVELDAEGLFEEQHNTELEEASHVELDSPSMGPLEDSSLEV